MKEENGHRCPEEKEKRPLNPPKLGASYRVGRVLPGRRPTREFTGSLVCPTSHYGVSSSSSTSKTRIRRRTSGWGCGMGPIGSIRTGSGPETAHPGAPVQRILAPQAPSSRQQTSFGGLRRGRRPSLKSKNLRKEVGLRQAFVIFLV